MLVSCYLVDNLSQRALLLGHDSGAKTPFCLCFLKLCKTGSVSSVILLDSLGACQSDERLFVWEKVWK